MQISFRHSPNLRRNPRLLTLGAVILSLWGVTPFAQAQTTHPNDLDPELRRQTPTVAPEQPKSEAPSDAPPLAQTEPPAPPTSPVVPSLRHAPRVFSLAAGWAYSPLSYLPLAEADPGTRFQTHGIRIDGKFGWQVGGFASRYPSYVGFMTGFFYLFGGSVADSLGIDYGIFAKHVIVPGQKVRAFLAYGLGATQVWVRSHDGRGIGHVTRLSAGVDFRLSRRVDAELECSYQFNILPTFSGPLAEGTRSHDFHTVQFLVGLWFGEPRP
ncbi:MAG TPA: hypothetical protein PKE31_19045 [Pseudomonadota bacterium]|nr:hypothetical protein [Pseudomonadota bacterium]